MTWLPAVMLLVGVLALVFKIAIAKQITAFVGTPLGVKADNVALIIAIVGIALGGFGVLWTFGTGLVSGTTATITGADGTQDTVDYTGTISIVIHDGLSNATTTEDYVDDSEVFMEIFSADANIADGEEYLFNITVDRSQVAYADTVLVTCSIADKEISGVTADNLAEKTLGKIDLDINDGGSHVNDNTVEKLVSFGTGDSSIEVQVAFDQEETYHDGMADMSDYNDVICTVADNDQSLSTTLRIKANS